MPIVSGAYRPPWIFQNGHFSTIYSAIVRNVKNPGQQRERLELNDGDFLDLDWTYSRESGKRVVVLLHGLEGNAQRPYMLGSARAFSESGYDVCAVNMRGCSGEPNRLYRSYHSGATEDLIAVLDYLNANHTYHQIFLKGFSLGANLILKYLGEYPESNKKITAAVAVSAPARAMFFSCTTKSLLLVAPGRTSNTAFSIAIRLFSAIMGWVHWKTSTTRKPDNMAIPPSVRSM